MSPELENNPENQPREQQIFLDILEKLRKNNFYEYDFGVLGEELEMNGKISNNSHLLPKKDGIYLPYEILEGNTEIKFPDRVGMDIEPELSMGRDASRNFVFFGNLILCTFDNNDDSTIKVAVKPFLDRTTDRQLTQELSMFERLKIADLATPEILAMVKKGDNHFLVTRFMSEAITLDSLDWDNLPEEVRETTINRGLLALVALHKNRLFHGDAAPRNITIQPELDTNWYVDLELGVGATQPIDILMGIKGDLRAYYEGVAKLLHLKKNYKSMVELILIPYFMNIIEEASNTDDSHEGIKMINDLTRQLCKEFKREFEGNPIGMPE